MIGEDEICPTLQKSCGVLEGEAPAEPEKMGARCGCVEWCVDENNLKISANR